MPAEFPLPEDFELGGWTVRPGRLILERDGEVVHVKPKTMEVLVALADRAGEVVTREQLLENIWQNAYVTDDVITQAIGELRKTLGDDFRQPAFVETIPRRGYRLLQPVRVLRSEPSPEPDVEVAVGDALPRAGQWLSRRAAVASIAAVALVAVGGFAVYVGSGLLGDIASELRLLRESTQNDRDRRPTHDTEAYELYLKARQKFSPHRSAAEQMEEALGLVERAVKRDPGFAEAYALIAEIYTFKGFWNHGPQDEVLVQARQAAKAALEIDPELGSPHAVSGLVTAVLEWKWEEGYLQAVRATELDPGDGRSLSLRAVLSLTRGRSREAVTFAYRAYELDPINPHALGILSWVLYQARDYDKAAEFMGKTLEADSDAAFARNFRPLALAYAGQFEEALAAERGRKADGEGASAHRENLPLILILAGRREEARRYLLQLEVPEEAVETAWGYLGHQEIVFERLDRLVEKRMTNYLMWLRTGPAWDPVRDDPRFQRVLERVGLTGQASDQDQTAQPGSDSSVME